MRGISSNLYILMVLQGFFFFKFILYNSENMFFKHVGWMLYFGSCGDYFVLSRGGRGAGGGGWWWRGLLGVGGLGLEDEVFALLDVGLELGHGALDEVDLVVEQFAQTKVLFYAVLPE